MSERPLRPYRFTRRENTGTPEKSQQLLGSRNISNTRSLTAVILDNYRPAKNRRFTHRARTNMYICVYEYMCSKRDGLLNRVALQCVLCSRVTRVQSKPVVANLTNVDLFVATFGC